MYYLMVLRGVRKDKDSLGFDVDSRCVFRFAYFALIPILYLKGTDLVL